MSKIAEQKALEAYPVKKDRIYYGLPLINGAEPFTDDVNIPQRNAYIQGYDQAFQDFLEKACEWLKENSESYVRFDEVGYRCYANNSLIKDFKNYMKKEG